MTLTEWLEKQEALCNAATPGPWYFHDYGEKCYGTEVITAFSVEENGPMPNSGERIELFDENDKEIAIVDEEIFNSEHQNGQADCMFAAASRLSLPTALKIIKTILEANEDEPLPERHGERIAERMIREEIWP